MTDADADVDAALRELTRHLEATEELAVRPAASPWLGEAAAVAGSLVDADLPETVLEERVRRVRELLDEVETTGNRTADERVEAASRAAERVVDALAGDA